MTVVRFEQPCGEYQDGFFNLNGTTIATGNLIEIIGDMAIVEFDSAPHETGLEHGVSLRLPLSQLDIPIILAESFESVDRLVFQMLDLCTCPTCGPRLKSKGEAHPQKAGFVCTACNSLCISQELDIPF